MIDTILTDLDGVIRIWSPQNDRKAEEATGLPEGTIRMTAFSKDLLFPAITGQISDDLWRQQIVERLSQSFPQINAVQAVKLWSATSGEVDSEVLEILRACRKKVQIALISNATSRLSSDLQRLGIVDEFDCVINSSELGCIKPDPEIYSKSLSILGTSAEQVFFVDDNSENVEAASKLGMTGHVYIDADTFRRELNHLGLLSIGSL